MNPFALTIQYIISLFALITLNTKRMMIVEVPKWKCFFWGGRNDKQARERSSGFIVGVRGVGCALP